MSLIDGLTLLIGSPIDAYQQDILYVVACIITVIGVMFFYKLFLLIGGFISPKR